MSKTATGIERKETMTEIPQIWGKAIAQMMDDWLFNHEAMLGKQKQNFHEWYGSLSRWDKFTYKYRQYRHKLWMKIPIRIITTKRYEDIQNYDW